MLSAFDRALLLDAARAALRQAVRGGPPAAARTDSEALRSQRGAFVTLRLDGELRGCIGYVDPVRSLLETVELSAAAAATEDRRFPPVREEELPLIEIEISALSAPEPISGPEEIEIGTHGVLLETSHRRGLLLPQVALEQDWDARTLLEHTAAKAGLPRSAWRGPGVRLYRFTAEIFRDEMAQRVRNDSKDPLTTNPR
jgi:AmmeMemoRadiSam system protein A